MAFKWEDFQDLASACANLFNSEFLSDVKFEFPCGKVIFAHSFLLSLRGSGFYEAFKESIGVSKLVQVEDYSYKNFHDFLKSIYTCDTRAAYSVKDSLEMLKIAKQYGVYDEEKKTADFITKSINEANACTILEASINEEWHLIKSRVLEYGKVHLKGILNGAMFDEAPQPVVNALLKWPFSEHNTKEYEIFEAVMKWASKACTNAGLDESGKSKRQVLGDTLKLIRFPVMSGTEFSNCIKLEPGLLENNEISSIFLMISNCVNENPDGFLNYNRLHIVHSPCVKLYKGNTPQADFPASGKRESKFTVSKLIELTGFGHIGTKGEVNFEILGKDGQIYRANFQNDSSSGLIYAIRPPITMEPNQAYRIEYTLTKTEPQTKKRCKQTNAKQIDFVGDGDVNFQFINLSPNIYCLYYNLK